MLADHHAPGRLEQAYAYLKSKGAVENRQDMAKQLEISISYLSHVLNGKKPFTEKFARKVSAQFGISDVWLLEGAGEPPVQISAKPSAYELLEQIARDVAAIRAKLDA